MEQGHASQIADLLNNQNQLAIAYDAERVLEKADEYLFELSEDGRIACCCQLKRVQWYQSEISHVTTHADFVRQGLGGRLIAIAEKKARDDGARLIQCTIRAGNGPSEGIFKKLDFKLDRLLRIHRPAMLSLSGAKRSSKQGCDQARRNKTRSRRDALTRLPRFVRIR